jgi:hypothetical protein
LTNDLAVPDLRGWSGPEPAKVENQLRVLALPCVDSLKWGSQALGERYAATGLMAQRFMAESYVIMAWLTESADEIDRQRRAFQLLVRDNDKSRRTTARVLQGETDPDKRRWDEDALARITDEERRLRRLASSMGFDTIDPVPSTQQLFDWFWGPYGYAHFQLESNHGGHPGLLFALPFTDWNDNLLVIDAEAALGLRAYRIRSLIISGLEIGRLVGLAIGWAEWVEGTLRPIAEEFGPLEEAARIAFYGELELRRRDGNLAE